MLRSNRFYVVLITLAASVFAALVSALPTSIELPAERRETRTVAGEAPAGDPLFALFLAERHVEELFARAPEGRRETLARAVKRFYAEREHRLAWSHDLRPTASASALVGALEASTGHGLSPELYATTDLKRRLRALQISERWPGGEELYDLDLRLTAAFVLYGNHLLQGRTDPRAIDPEWHLEQRSADLAAVLAEALGERGVEAALESVAPSTDEYRGLREAYLRYRQLAARGGWGEVIDGPTLEVGEPAPRERLESLAARLEVEGDLPAEAAAALRRQWRKSGEAEVIYGPPLTTAVERFQERHGLDTDGKVGPRTSAALAVPAEERLRQIAVGLERLRWRPEVAADRHIRVNLAAFELKAVEGEEEALRMPVVVGKKSWATPAFGDAITSIEVNPYWNVPKSIAAQEVLPAIRSDQSYVYEESFEILSGWGPDAEVLDPAEVPWSEVSASSVRFRQRPGPKNALGRVKLLFPNRFSIYLHDTPGRRAFERSQRALSHGCVRVSRPLELTRFVLETAADTPWEEVESMLGRQQPHRIVLDEPVPVVLYYQTAFFDAGRTHFREDVYGRDAALAAALEAPTRRARAVASGP